jgi:hypothetical protein
MSVSKDTFREVGTQHEKGSNHKVTSPTWVLEQRVSLDSPLPARSHGDRTLERPERTSSFDTNETDGENSECLPNKWSALHKLRTLSPGQTQLPWQTPCTSSVFPRGNIHADLSHFSHGKFKGGTFRDGRNLPQTVATDFRELIQICRAQIFGFINRKYFWMNEMRNARAVTNVSANTAASRELRIATCRFLHKVPESAQI